MNSERIESIDIFRGIAIAGMVIANFIAGVDRVPAWLKHAPDAGFTVIDLVAPMFIFAIGLTYAPSARRRLAESGAWKMTLHFLKRFFAILGIGALLSAGEIALGVDGQTVNWGVLQAIGVAGLVTLIVIRAKTSVRLAVGLLLLGLYQFLLQRFWLSDVLAASHGGFYGAISWSAMLILATAFADFFHQTSHRVRNLVLIGMAAVLIGLLLTLWFPVSKNRVSAPYVLLALGLSVMVFTACHLLVDRFKLSLRLLTLWGKNPLVLYVLHMLLLGIVVLPGLPAFYSKASWWLVVLEGGVLVSVLTIVAWMLDRRKLFVSL